MDQIGVTKDYLTVSVSEDLVGMICETDPYDNKSQTNDFNTIHSIVHNDQSINYNNNGYTPFSNEDQYPQETVSITVSLQAYLSVLYMKIFYTISMMTFPWLYMYYRHY